MRTEVARRLHLKRHGALIAWRCIPFGHDLGPVEPNGWSRCLRAGCTLAQQEVKDL